jgi:hypothetical protein
MHYSGGSSQRVDTASGLAQIDEMIKDREAYINRRDAEAASAVARNPYSWEARKEKLAWEYERPVQMDALASLKRNRQLSSPDTDWRPAPNGFFVGSDS